MSILPSNPTNGIGVSTSNAASYTTGSISPTPGKVLYAAIVAFDAGLALATSGWTLTGCGITWTEMRNIGTTSQRLVVFRAYADPALVTAGTLVFAGLVGTADMVRWNIVEVDGVDPTTNNGVVQSVTANGAADTNTATLAAFANVDNGTLAFLGSHAGAGGALTLTQGSGFTMLSQNNQIEGSEAIAIGCQWRIDNDTSVDASVTTNNDRLMIVAMELKAAPLPTDLPIYPYAVTTFV